MNRKAALCIMFASLILLTEGNTVTLLPDGIAEVISGNPLSLQCIYNGAYSPFTFNFYLNNDTNGLQISVSNCMIAIAVGYNTSLYNQSCGTNNVSLIILAVSQERNGQKWECDVSFITADPTPPKDFTIIKVTVPTIPTTPEMSKQCQPSECQLVLGLGLGLGLGIPIVITIIVVVIFICTVSSVQTYVGSEAHFNFMLTEDSKESEVHIKNKSGGVVMIARGKEGRSGDPVYKGRVNFTGNTNQKLISFILRNVTLSDAGIYIAVHSDANKIIGCQALIVKGTTSEDKSPKPDGNKPEQVPLQPIGPTFEDKPPEPDSNKPEQVPLKPIGCNRPYILGLVLGLGLGIAFIVGCIIIAILISTDTITCKLEFGLALGLSLGMSCVIAIIIAVIFICKGIPNRVKFGKGILTGLLYASVIGIFVVYLIGTNDEDNPQETDGTKNDKVPLTPAEVSSVQTYVGSEANFNFMLTEDSKESEVLIKNKSFGIVMTARGKKGRSDDPVYKDRVNFTGNTNQKLISFILRNVTLSDAGIYIAVHSDANRIIGCQMLIVKDTKDKTKNPGSSAVSREQVQVQMENKGVKDDDEERPPAVHTGTQNKVDPNTRSKQTNDRQQLVPPANTGFEDTSTFRPLPAPPQNGEIKDRNVRGISATIGDIPDLASETPRPIRLLPLIPKQATVQKEDASEEPKRKKKKKKKKDQTNVETPEEENGETDMRVN